MMDYSVFIYVVFLLLILTPVCIYINYNSGIKYIRYISDHYPKIGAWLKSGLNRTVGFGNDDFNWIRLVLLFYKGRNKFMAKHQDDEFIEEYLLFISDPRFKNRFKILAILIGFILIFFLVILTS